MVNHATKNEKAKITVTPCFNGTINPAMIDVNEKDYCLCLFGMWTP